MNELIKQKRIERELARIYRQIALARRDKKIGESEAREVVKNYLVDNKEVLDLTDFDSVIEFLDGGYTIH